MAETRIMACANADGNRRLRFLADDLEGNERGSDCQSKALASTFIRTLP
jgi:hypothetical protein